MKANDAILKNMQTNMTSLTNSNLELKNMFGQFMKINTTSSSGSRTLTSNTVTNPKEDLKGITTLSGTAYKGPTIPTTYSPSKVAEHKTEVTKDMVPPTNNGTPVSAPKPNPKPSIPYPSRLNDQKLCNKANDQKEKFFQIFQDLNFNISFADALILMPKNLFPPLDNPELTIRRRPRVDPTLLNDFEMATDRNGDLPVPDLRTMEELCQPTLNGRGGPMAPIAIQAMNFRLKNDMIQQVQNSCQFYGLPGDDANKHLDKFLHVTPSIKVNGVTDDALRLYLFPHSLTHHATAWFDHLPRNYITTFEQMAKMFLEKYFPPCMVTKLRNEITNFRQRPDESLFKAWECYNHSIDRCPNHNMLPVTQIDTFYNGLTLRHRDTINVAAGGTFMKRRPEECYDLIKNMTAHHND
uniref:Reverse transcriptase domain-containing protein n=1 Tax=Tanacetum cinerariifolium TaxID=118510 RepID=A0A699GR97_TANCI|nr:reverse transcriptase domain-containing protein [Tanacetum cinerariifolium]